jgi:hypothetical protein
VTHTQNKYFPRCVYTSRLSVLHEGINSTQSPTVAGETQQEIGPAPTVGFASGGSQS